MRDFSPRRGLRGSLSLLGVLSALSSCTLTFGTHECDKDADCPKAQGQAQSCTQDHLCMLGTPPEKVCSQVYMTPSASAGAAQVQLGFIGQLGGGQASAGVTDRLQLEAVELGLDQFNMLAGTTKRTLVLNVCDSSRQPQDALTAMKYLIREKKVAGVVGPPSSREVLDVAAEAAAGQTPLVSPSATSPSISSVPQQGIVYRMAPSDALQGPVLARLLSKIVAPATQQQVALLYVNDAYGTGLQTAFTNAATSANIVVSRTFAENDAAAVKAGVSAVLAQSGLTDVVVIANRDAPSIMLQLQTLPTPVQILMADAAESDDMLATFKQNPLISHFARLRGSAPATGASTQPYSAFRNAFMARFPGDDPTGNSFTGYAYDAFFAVATGLGNAKGDVTPAAVAAGIGKISGGSQSFSVLTDSLKAYQAVAAGQTLALVGVTGSITLKGPDRMGASFEQWQIDTTNPSAPKFKTAAAP